MKYLKSLTNRKISVISKKLKHQIDILSKIINIRNITKTMMESIKTTKELNRDTSQEYQEKKKRKKKLEDQVVEEKAKVVSRLKIKFK